MRRFVRALVVLGLPVAVSTVVGAQAPPPPPGQTPPPPMTNLQIIPKDTPRPDVIATMQRITAALGVACTYCHMGQAPTFDFASDAKPTKAAARKMMLMTRELNPKVAEAVSKPAAETTRVGCATCHRGQPIPKLLPDVLTEAAAKSGIPAAIQQYRELRTKYYGGQSYDFSELALVQFAQPLVNTNKSDDAIPWLQLNVEFYPNSAPTYTALGLAYMRKNDKDNAIKNFEKAVQLDPNNQNAKRQLEQLKK